MIFATTFRWRPFCVQQRFKHALVHDSGTVKCKCVYTLLHYHCKGLAHPRAAHFDERARHNAQHQALAIGKHEGQQRRYYSCFACAHNHLPNFGLLSLQIVHQIHDNVDLLVSK